MFMLNTFDRINKCRRITNRQPMKCHLIDLFWIRLHWGDVTLHYRFCLGKCLWCGQLWDDADFCQTTVPDREHSPANCAVDTKYFIPPILIRTFESAFVSAQNLSELDAAGLWICVRHCFELTLSAKRPAFLQLWLALNLTVLNRPIKKWRKRVVPNQA